MVDLTDVKVRGSPVHRILRGFLNEGLAQSILKQYFGTEDIDVHKYYSAEKFFDVLYYISKNFSPILLRKVGFNLLTPEHLPKEVTDLESAFISLDTAYRSQHKPNMASKIGGYVLTKNAMGNYELVCNNPYPCDFDYGMIRSIVNHFEEKAILKHKQESCRKNGADECIYEIRIFD